MNYQEIYDDILSSKSTSFQDDFWREVEEAVAAWHQDFGNEQLDPVETDWLNACSFSHIKETEDNKTAWQAAVLERIGVDGAEIFI